MVEEVEGREKFKKVSKLWDVDLCQACGGNGVHRGCNKQGRWSKNSEEIEYTCTDCGGDGPTLMERERPKVISDAINTSLNSTFNSSHLLTPSSSMDSSMDTSMNTSKDTSMDNCTEMVERKEERSSKSGFFARKEEMLSLLAGIVERAKREDGAVEMEKEKEEEKIDEDIIKDEIEESRQSESKEQKRKGQLWIRRDLAPFGAEALSGNICDSEDVQMEVAEPVHEDIDGDEVKEGEEGVGEVDEADLPGENPIRSIPPAKRTFGNRLLKILEENPAMLRPKQKPQTCYMSFFFKMINPLKSQTPQSDQQISDQPLAQSDHSVSLADQLNIHPEKLNSHTVNLNSHPEKTAGPQEPIALQDQLVAKESEVGNASFLEIDDIVQTQENEAKKKDETEEKLLEIEMPRTEVEDMEVVESNVDIFKEKVASVESESLEINISKEVLVEEKETEKDEEEPVKKYRRGPKSRKRLLEIKTKEESPKKVKVSLNPLLEAFQTCFTVDEFKKAKETKNGEINLAFKLFKLWFNQLNTDINKCAECEKVSAIKLFFKLANICT